jgi:hypothetical protein
VCDKGDGGVSVVVLVITVVVMVMGCFSGF